MIVITNTNSYKHPNFDTNLTAKGFHSADAFLSCFLLNLLKCCGQVFERKKRSTRQISFFLSPSLSFFLSPSLSFSLSISLSFFLSFLHIGLSVFSSSFSPYLSLSVRCDVLVVFLCFGIRLDICMYVRVILYVVYRCIYVCVIVAIGVLYICAFDG